MCQVWRLPVKANALAALPLLTTSFHTPEYPWSMWGSCKGVHVTLSWHRRQNTCDFEQCTYIIYTSFFFYISSKIWNHHILIWYPTPFLAWASHLTFTSAPPPPSKWRAVGGNNVIHFSPQRMWHIDKCAASECHRSPPPVSIQG